MAARYFPERACAFPTRPASRNRVLKKPSTGFPEILTIFRIRDSSPSGYALLRRDFNKIFFGDKYALTGTYFNNLFRDQINYVTTNNPPNYPGEYVNVNQAFAQGAEILFRAKLSSTLLVNSAYTYTSSQISQQSHALRCHLRSRPTSVAPSQTFCDRHDFLSRRSRGERTWEGVSSAAAPIPTSTTSESIMPPATSAPTSEDGMPSSRVSPPTLTSRTRLIAATTKSSAIPRCRSISGQACAFALAENDAGFRWRRVTLGKEGQGGIGREVSKPVS